MGPESDRPSRQSGDPTLVGGVSVEGERVLGRVMTGLFGPGAAEPTTIGGFVIEGRLGVGAMGEVFAAYDPELDRRVAIKLLRTPPDAERARLARNMRREAQALARLAHPNVVPVFAVGEDEDRLYIVMELVEGMTLRRWLAAKKRKRGEILDMFMAVARGLSAAHSARVVHRDFKPDNVLVGDDGRPRLVDFGLARAEADAGEIRDSSAPAASQTRRTAIAGTPRYMAPEQFLGDEIDHRADQFAFCISVYEALHGVTPFSGSTAPEIARKVLEYDIDPPPKDSDVPATIDRVLRRGLAREPDHRFENMGQLLAALQRARGAQRRRALMLALGLVIVGGVGLLARAQSKVSACREQARAAAVTWGDAQPGIDAAIRETGVPYAEHAVGRIGEALDGWTDAWSSARQQSCLARDADVDAPARVDVCLDDRLIELEVLLSVLSRADEEVASRAVGAVLALPRVGDCTDPVRLAATPLPTPEQREAVAPVRRRVAEVRALTSAGRFGEAADAASDLLPRAEASGYPPVHARVSLVLGEIEAAQSHFDTAARRLEQAYFVAGRHGLDRTAALAASRLVEVLGVHSQRVPQAKGWAAHARMVAERLGEPDARMAMLHATGMLALDAGEYEEGIARLEESVALRIATHGELHPDVGVDLIAIGGGFSAAGDNERARIELERAHESLLRSEGEGHPHVADAIHNLGNVEAREGHLAEAADLHRRALAIRERALPPEHLAIAESLLALGGVLGNGGDVVAARTHTERALAILEAALGPDHPRLVDPLLNLGISAAMEGQPRQALAYTERACELLEDLPGEERPRHASCLDNLGDAYHALGRNEESLVAYRSALAIHERTGGPEHPKTALTQHNLGLVMIDLEQPEEGLALMERADEGLGRALPEGHNLRFQTRLGLAGARLDAGQTALAEALLESMLRQWGDDPQARAEIEPLLARAHSRRPSDRITSRNETTH